MKCKTIRDVRADVNCYPQYVTLDAAGRKVIAAGTVICKDEFPLADCVTLVVNGLAVPEDDECREACGKSAAELSAARAAMTRLLSGRAMDKTELEGEPGARSRNV